MQILVTAAPTVEPVSLADVKGQLRVLHTNEDATIARLARVARSMIEGKVSRALMDQGIRLELPAFPVSGVIRLPRPPVISVTSVHYRDTAGATQTLDPSLYVFTADELTPRITIADGAAWPETQTHPAAVFVDYRAGFGTTPEAVPEDLRHAILLTVEHFYANRGATVEGSRNVLPLGVDALVDRYRTSGWI